MAHDGKDQYAEVFEEGHSGTEHSVHERMRANSTIMQLKKILGGASPTSGVLMGLAPTAISSINR